MWKLEKEKSEIEAEDNVNLNSPHFEDEYDGKK